MKKALLLAAAAALLLCVPLAFARADGERPANSGRYERYAAAHMELSEAELKLALALKLDEPSYKNVVVVNRPSSLGVLVSKHFALPAGYVPAVLEDVDKNYAMDGVQLRADCCAAFLEMARAAERQGAFLYIKSGYRVNKTNDDPDDMWNAWPGHSEHQTGLAFDLRLKGKTRTLLRDYRYETSFEYAWLCAHACDYGFVLSYPEGESDTTGYEFEPWHWRYVGVRIATDMRDKGFSTFPEYWAAYLMARELRAEPPARIVASVDSLFCRFACAYAEAE
ncbi:MAG: M15 family metallopeptidase [Clostridiaceae bacterium]|nr:M15 family metallopeptidase [Eubacteriales bacterium]